MMKDTETSDTNNKVNTPMKTSVKDAPRRLRKAFIEPPLDNIDEFALKHNKYEHCIVAAYHIYRDLHIKRDMNELELNYINTQIDK